MKRTIIAAGTAAALGLVASVAHAVAYFGPGNTAPMGLNAAQSLEQATGGAGHMLFTPYYNAQGATATNISITNTDTSNGKAVKVRFRGATNSDDVLDFTLFLSPGDVWTASLARTGPSGEAWLKTPDNSCTLPAFGDGVGLRTSRLPQYVNPTELQRIAAEGYIEVLNMADIPPGSALYTATKHVAGVPGGALPLATGSGDPRYECETALAAMYDQTVLNAAGAEAMGLYAPTGGLVGSWAIVNQTQNVAYSGGMTAIRAVDGPNGTGNNAYGLIAFAPQIGEPYSAEATWPIKSLTADVLFENGDADWQDLPDMSTPIVGTYAGNPIAQIAAMDLQHGLIMNEYVSDPNGAASGVPMNTDWVVSQPTRRYYAAVRYGSALSEAEGWVRGKDQKAAGDVSNPYASALAAGGRAQVSATGVPFLCLNSSFLQTRDREEGSRASGATWSPGTSLQPVCGEVFTLTFGNMSPMNAQVTNQTVNPTSVAGTAGWGRVNTGQRLPLVGFAATNAGNTQTGVWFGQTLPHRWND